MNPATIETIQPTLQQKRDIAKQFVRTHFKDDTDAPFEMTDGQADIYLSITAPDNDRTEIIAPTQYGKSSIIAMALISVSQFDGEEYGIVTGSEPKSQIIMEKVIQHAFDNSMWRDRLEIDPTETLDRIRRSRTRKHITWKGGGGIRTFTADSRNRQRVKESLTGFGAKNIIEDEASLIPDDLQAMIMRMIGGHKGGRIWKIGNPFYRNHFLRSWQDDRYTHIYIDYHQALREGRYDEGFISEMRSEAFFDVLYECKFPSDNEIDEMGWRRMLTDDQLEEAFRDAELEPPKGDGRLGVDIAAGGANYTAFVIRWDNKMKLLEKNRDPDLMAQVAKIESYMKEYEVDEVLVSVDDVGVGHGVSNRLAERGFTINAVKEGASADENDKYTNKRAEMFWLFGEWVKNGGKIEKHTDFYQLASISYKEDSSSRLKIIPKADLSKRGIASPDVADAGSLTFSNSVIATSADFEII